MYKCEAWIHNWCPISSISKKDVTQWNRSWGTSSELEVQIKEEIQKLLNVGFIKPVQHSTWLADIVLVKKKNGQIRCCIDFRDLNKAYPKDEFSLPNIDMLVGATARYLMFSFMDGFSGYNQIRMDSRYVEKTAFRTPIGNFYCTVIPFGFVSSFPDWLALNPSCESSQHMMKWVLRNLLDLKLFPIDEVVRNPCFSCSTKRILSFTDWRSWGPSREAL